MGRALWSSQISLQQFGPSWELAAAFDPVSLHRHLSALKQRFYRSLFYLALPLFAHEVPAFLVLDYSLLLSRKSTVCP